MKAISSFETSVTAYPETRRHNAEEQSHQAHHHENIKEFIRVFHYAFAVLHKGTYRCLVWNDNSNDD
jgi:hypothetical protein